MIGHREVPGRPALYATTTEFLSYFNLKNLSELPPLLEPRDLDAIAATLESFQDIADDTDPRPEDDT